MSLLNTRFKDKPMLLLRASCCLERALLFDAGVDFEVGCLSSLVTDLAPCTRERAGRSSTVTTAVTTVVSGEAWGATSTVKQKLEG
jgi:hypothetical protein